MAGIPDDIMEKAAKAAQIIASTKPAGEPEDDRMFLEHAKHVISLALLEEREAHGGASAIMFGGNLLLHHPDMPLHMWDGETLEPVRP